jgi:hypothetical protein
MNSFQLSSDWIDFYPNISPNQTISMGNTNFQFSSDNGSIYFTNTIFINITHSGEGGALYFYSSSFISNKVLIEESFFIECRTTSSGMGGGAVYLSQYGDCIFRLVCGSGCFSYSNVQGQFCYLSTESDKSNFIFSISSLVSNINSIGNYLSYLLYGNHFFQSTNISNNQFAYCSGWYLHYPNFSYIKFSSIENNFATTSLCLGFWNGEKSSNLEYTNIINNYQTSSSYGHIDILNHYLNLNNCSLLNNTGNGVLFMISSGFILINDCFIDLITGDSAKYSIINSFTNSFTNINLFLNTAKCLSENTYFYQDLLKTQTNSNYPKTQRLCILPINKEDFVFFLSF